MVASATDSESCGTLTSTIDISILSKYILLEGAARLLGQHKAFDLAKSTIDQGLLLVLVQV